DAAQPPVVERERRRVFGGARFHLDERQHASAAGDDVDFAAAHAGLAGKDPPAFQAQIPAGESLGAAAALLGFMAIHLRERSSARAYARLRGMLSCSATSAAARDGENLAIAASSAASSSSSLTVSASDGGPTTITISPLG